MSMYSSTDILQAKDECRVYISPFNTKQLNPNSYDVCLDGAFFLLTGEIGPEPHYIGPFSLEIGKRVYIPKGATLLGRTIEIVGTTVNVVAEIRSKSSVRRSGITICDDAGFGDVGFWNRWTVELTAHSGDYRASLVVGEPFAQMVFFETKSAPICEYQGQYNENDLLSMIPKKYRKNIITPTLADHAALTSFR